MFRRLRAGRPAPSAADPLASIPVPAEAVAVLSGPAEFRTVLLERIARARHRIILVALYLQDDLAGREIMEALYAAHRANPSLEIQVLVDQHRAQRGLIGKAKSPGNAAMYRECAARFGKGVQVRGVAVRSRELFGVLHLKGFIIDDTVLYSGASLNEVYLARKGRYRLDRYHLFESAPLAACMADFVRSTFLRSPAVRSLGHPPHAAGERQASAMRAFRRALRTARYTFEGRQPGPGEVAVTPLCGLGAGNPLNDALLALMKSARRRLVIYTPYFNLPRPVSRVVSHLLALGREVTIVVGDKTANDFYIPPAEPFKTIGLLPYLYEGNLCRFAKAHQQAIADGRLNVFLWRHGDNSFHLKGVFVDDETAVVTGNNLNPRAWALDLENGLVIRDPEGLLKAKHEREHAAILEHATRLASFHDLETPGAYPAQVRKALRRMNRTRIDRLLNRLL
ncbi:CDP-diacylglycerol--serine O-phosphatidyltransferase [Geothrix paludis]|uniref:CDP-diacylglycerol--serine O-phosphatidyltransferase n=1 Tax=Geothrix paludis TaxID=2922722 RepID=UPI001FAC2C40|nr:CDP-diacylglycerol--serine O-phosphatidyltransferase [Geothrix paludis]